MVVSYMIFSKLIALKNRKVFRIREDEIYWTFDW